MLYKILHEDYLRYFTRGIWYVVIPISGAVIFREEISLIHYQALKFLIFSGVVIDLVLELITFHALRWILGYRNNSNMIVDTVVEHIREINRNRDILVEEEAVTDEQINGTFSLVIDQKEEILERLEHLSRELGKWSTRHGRYCHRLIVEIHTKARLVSDIESIWNRCVPQDRRIQLCLQSLEFATMRLLDEDGQATRLIMIKPNQNGLGIKESSQ